MYPGASYPSGGEIGETGYNPGYNPTGSGSYYPGQQGGSGSYAGVYPGSSGMYQGSGAQGGFQGSGAQGGFQGSGAQGGFGGQSYGYYPGGSGAFAPQQEEMIGGPNPGEVDMAANEVEEENQ